MMKSKRCVNSSALFHMAVFVLGTLLASMNVGVVCSSDSGEPTAKSVWVKWDPSPVDPNYCGVQIDDEHSGYVLPEIPADYRLVQVQVVTRHGARTPYQYLPGDRTVWECLNTQLAIDDVQPLRRVRHVDRLYRKRFIQSREMLAGNCSLGWLTTLGVSQHEVLGNALRARYVLDQQFVTALTPDQVYLRSTDVVRTQQSLQSDMLHLFPPETDRNVSVWEHETLLVDVETIEYKADTLHPNRDRCPRLRQLYSELAMTDTFRATVESIADVQSELERIYPDYDFTDPHWVIDFADTFHSMDCHGKPFPVQITPDMLLRLFAAADVQWGLEWSSSEGDLGIGEFALEMVDQVIGAMQSTRTHEPQARYRQYSAHDTTLAPLLSVFQTYEAPYWPPFASLIQLELLQHISTNKYSVRFIYNNQVKTMAGCSSALCPVDEFLAMMAPLRSIDFEAECQITGVPAPVPSDDYDNNVQVERPVAVMLGLLGIISLFLNGAFGYLYCSNRVRFKRHAHAARNRFSALENQDPESPEEEEDDDEHVDNYVVQSAIGDDQL
eukprot:CAMPEP_0177684740 /NCGR_PEP_ID=MMETSP0447-20121125/32596_1 /TAXON_ID=0 /ORGANISM="Stygamoeba regulata, Strain BSH-02190019" /LENGTH=553 /DNA_ID=CAMNT_0019194615 /DNA_START=175 /DNA_END=1836 /DNA_ORIENTATION=-